MAHFWQNRICEKVPFSPGESGTFNLRCFLVINRIPVKSKVSLLNKWDISGKTDFCEKVPFSPGESGTFKLSGFLVINRFSVKSKVALLDKWHIFDKKKFHEKVAFSPGESHFHFKRFFGDKSIFCQKQSYST